MISTEKSMTPGGPTIEERAQNVLEFARERSKTAENWLELHEAIFSYGGKCNGLFSTQQERVAFSRTPQYAAIQQLIQDAGKLNQTGKERYPEILQRASGKFIVRLPKSIHAALTIEAEQEGISLNQLVLAKLAVSLNACILESSRQHLAQRDCCEG